MTENESDLAFALKMYGEKAIEYAQAITDEQKAIAIDNMAFWHHHLTQSAAAVAAERV